MPAPLLALCTCPDPEVARTIAHALVHERLAACVNRVPGVVSTWRWEGQVQEGNEILLLIKTSDERLAALRARLLELHPFEVPELIAVSIADGLPAYLAWLDKATTG